MGEHNTNPNSVLKAELTEEQKKYQEEIERKQAEFRKLLDTPITKDEAEKALAENNVNRCRVKALIQQCEAQYVQISLQIEKARTQLVDLDGEDAIIRRRMLNGEK